MTLQKGEIADQLKFRATPEQVTRWKKAWRAARKGTKPKLTFSGWVRGCLDRGSQPPPSTY